MAITRVFNDSVSEGDASSTCADFDVQTGDLIIVSIGTAYGNDSTMSEEAGNTFTELTPNDSGFASFGIRQRMWWAVAGANYTGNSVTANIDLGGNAHTMNVGVYRPPAGATWSVDATGRSVSTTPYVAPTINTSGEGVTVLCYSEQFASSAVTPSIGGTEFTLRDSVASSLQAVGIFDRLRTASESNIGGDTVTATDGRGMLYTASFVATPASAAQVSDRNGVALASISQFSGIAKASIAAVNGVTTV